MLNLMDWITVALTVGFTSFCAELAKDFKQYLAKKLKRSHAIVFEKLLEAEVS